jgi:endoglycosylceramidase
MATSWTRWLAARALILLLMPISAAAQTASPQTAAVAGGMLRASGRHFVDRAGRVVILRGVNLSGASKVPPFVPTTNAADLDRIRAMGMNVIRLVFIWEAYEPTPGQYDEAYLARMRWVAAEAWARGITTIVDIHQDGFSRHVSRGSGDGFPLWAVSARCSATKPDNGPGCKNWAMMVATDRNMHRSFTDFYADKGGVRTRYLMMIQRAASTFAAVPGVIGYDPLNEPWGDERRELGPLYEDAARVIRSVHPTAILFLEGHVTTNCGLQTKLPRPSFDNVAYAPHYYKPSAILRNGWHGRTLTIKAAFARMEAKAAEWNAPLFLGEFGVAGDATRAGDYVACLYDHLDSRLASGAQWNYTPGWNQRDKDGWNGEDFNILHPEGTLRPNFVDRPSPRAVAGVPVEHRFERSANGVVLTFTWEHHPERGDTEIHVPSRLFPRGSRLTVEGEGATARHDAARELLIVRSPRPGLVRVRLASR